MGLILVIIGLVLLALRGFGVTGPGAVHLGWLGLAVVTLGAFVLPAL